MRLLGLQARRGARSAPRASRSVRSSSSWRAIVARLSARRVSTSAAMAADHARCVFQPTTCLATPYQKSADRPRRVDVDALVVAVEALAERLHRHLGREQRGAVGDGALEPVEAGVGAAGDEPGNELGARVGDLACALPGRPTAGSPSASVWRRTPAAGRSRRGRPDRRAPRRGSRRRPPWCRRAPCACRRRCR